MCRQAEAVGGNFYDVFRLASGELVITLGDVSGKGLGAALMMASVQASLRERRDTLQPILRDIAALIKRANEPFYEASLELHSAF